MKVIDSFLFFNEFDILKLRLEYLKDVVDYFLICESKYTHSGKEKPYYLDTILNSFDEDIKSKIIRVKYEPDISDYDFSDTTKCDFESGFWKIERGQRDFIANNLEIFSKKDILIVSDADEIPNKVLINNIRNTNIAEDSIFTAYFDLFYYNFRTLNSNPCLGSFFVPINIAIESSLSELRRTRSNYSILDGGGWHFSYFGDINFISNKLESYAHQELNRDNYKNKEHILQSIQNKKDLFGRNEEEFQEYNFDNFPADLKEIIQKIFPQELYYTKNEPEISPSQSDQFMKKTDIEELLEKYSVDTENAELNFSLGIWYENQGHTAPALSYYLRAAERSEDEDLAYESLIRASFCYEKQGTRDESSKGLLYQAQAFRPDRPEAYFLLSKFAEKRSWWQDCYMNAEFALLHCNFDNKPLRTNIEYPGKYGLIFQKAISGWWWGKNDESGKLFTDLLENYDLSPDYKTAVLNNMNQYFKELLKPEYQVKEDKIVDYFTFYSPTGREMLKLRVNMLKDYVDEFIICESNKTQSGIPIEYELENILDELNLPKEKIKIIKLDIPDEDLLEVEQIDYKNCYDGNHQNKKSVYARVRERLQKDALLSVIENYSDNTVFIHSDIDEIIRPSAVDYVVNTVRENPEIVIRIPLIHLEGKANMRVYDKNSNTPKEWTGMFVATKKHLLKATPTQIRSNVFNPFQICFITEGERVVDDLGWHFSWMGNAKTRKTKCKAFTHYADNFDYLETTNYSCENMENFQDSLEIKEGSIPPSGDTNFVLRYYPTENLPKEIFEDDEIKNFLLPDHKILNCKEFFEQEYKSHCLQPSDINEHLPILYEYGKKCNHITEFGARTGVSTRAFLNTGADLDVYDLEIDDNLDKIIKKADLCGKKVTYNKANVLNIEIKETDLLFIDTLHNYDQLKEELRLHAKKVRKYIAFHDTHYYGVDGQTITPEEKKLGLLPAIIEFLIENPEWKFKLHKTNNNGLTIIEKKSPFP